MLQAAGDLGGAAVAYLAAGAADAAASALVAQRRFADAGLLIIAALDADLEHLGEMPAERQLWVLQAAACLERAGETLHAVGLLNAIGRRREAGAALMRARFSPDAVRPLDVIALRIAGAAVLSRLDRPVEAGRLFERAGRHFDAGLCLEEAGDRRGALLAFSRLAPGDSAYRQACVRLVGLAAQLAALDVALDHALGPFVASDPQGEAEEEAFRRLSDLYERQGLTVPARDVLGRLLRVHPGDAEAEQRLQRIEQAERRRRQVALRVLEEEAAFRQAGRGRPDPTPTVWPEPPRPTVPTPPPFVPELVLGRAVVPETQELPGVLRTTDLPLELGTVVSGRYRLDAMLGRGGMAVVYRAHDLELKEDIALKAFVAGEGDLEAEERFRREVFLSRRFAHPNLIRIHDLGVGSSARYFTMELLRGTDLRRRLQSSSPAPFASVLDVLIQTCAGLAAIHAAGVVHRDLKPENVFITDDGMVKLMDFGIAKLVPAPGLTIGITLGGTPLYMAPEQISNFGAVTSSSDLYSLGVIAYEMLTGDVPFRHPELMTLLMLQMYEEPVLPRTRRPEIPEALEQLTLSLLEKDPQSRPHDASAVASAFAAIRSGLISGA
jgi:serine/threonine-protein kinase